MTSSSDYETKARQLRALFRTRPSKQVLQAEYERLFGEPSLNGELENICKTAWKEGRELAGWTYDRSIQSWRRPDGSKVVEDDGSEWL